MRPVRTAFAGALLGTLLLAGCGQGGDTTTSAPPSAAPTTAATAASSGDFPVTVEAANGKVTIAKKPERIVSLSATHTETLFAIGAGPQVIAVDDQSNYPPEAPKADLSGFKPNVEAIVAKKPDLVIVSDDLDKVVAELGKVNVPVLFQPSAKKLDEAYEEIAELGAATGNKAKADEVVAGMKAAIGKLAAQAPKGKQLTYYHELDTTPYAATSQTFIGQIYGLFGLTNIADKAPDAAGGYPKLSAEFVAQADPDLIFLADVKCCRQSKDTLAKRPGWKDLSAVKNDRVIQLDDDIASRWGPRVVDLAEAIGTAVAKAGTS
ncbi:Vitamin B12 ABC transporter, B12-binding component BtuF [[Actinomadura] parvosata subsp. kistnae]|uniref:ABC transporter substrate-binding protein n=1 Tax=[Actinomadura] parvosata subsp. kistnae TaxID=1909395 RepID=A0A1V0A4C6_9ACTN|nr:ABC transporter substrate-binding protein [Nonomuraea sp. ATCC 55076]AQZ65054.1 ABC transporter substrate-binding protein [Nonomuraea sp. ATCC 55076]SPL96315.1 Vitamin B12 ABC transporter, B12-binding component BtuF [Actinomadura parvosata subsp. kistnae]